MELSHEDSLRLNVLLAQDLKAVRIDESAMVVYALTSRGEARVPLVSNCPDDRYLKRVRELFSAHALDSPGGYPVFLERWTRMRQTRPDSMQALLLLGEPEAIVAVANAPEISEELASYAWWAMPSAEIARNLLENATVSQGGLGKELAEFLLEFLPFESESLAIVDSVRLVLQPGLINAEQRQALWKKGARKSAFYIGFLYSAADQLPVKKQAHSLLQDSGEVLASLQANRYANQLLRLLGAPGQGFLDTFQQAMNRISDQDAMVALLNSLASYFRGVSPQGRPRCREYTEIQNEVVRLMASGEDAQLNELLQAVPGAETQIRAMLELAMVSETLVDPIFCKSDAIGSVMRKQLAPVTEPLARTITALMQ